MNMATKDNILGRSKAIADWLASESPPRSMPSSPLALSVSGCFSIVQDHHGAIVHLIDTGHHSPAFALARSVYEGYIRGAWLADCATDAQREAFLKGEIFQNQQGKKMEVADLIKDLELKEPYDENILSAIRDSAWLTLCDYAHVGGRLVANWNSGDGTSPAFTEDSIFHVLGLTGVFAAMAAIGLCQLPVPADEAFANRILEQVKNFNWNPAPDAAP